MKLPKISKIAVVLAAIAAIPMAANAASITIDSVQQRWPWNNKVDITYTVSGGQDVAAGVFARIEFTANIAGTEYLIDGVHDVGASASDGTHTVTWTLPIGVKSDSCTMTAKLFSADNPSGDDYMIVDLTKTSGNITWEGLMATQQASNERYNTADYKTDKLVLRKVPRWADRSQLPNAASLSSLNGYPTGDSANYSSGNNANSSTTWNTAKNYYIGVFLVTQYQYQKLYGSNPSAKKTLIAGNEVTHRPVEQVSWDDLRLSTTAPTSSIPAVASNSGTFFQRLNYITGNQYGFDLPTEVMFEIAERAGATTTYYWGNTVSTNYIVCSDNAGSSTVAVGSRLPNEWGLYDTAGNVWEWCLDATVYGNLTARVDAFTPAWASGAASRRTRGGAGFSGASSTAYFRASYRHSDTSSKRYQGQGFRVSRIVD